MTNYQQPAPPPGYGAPQPAPKKGMTVGKVILIVLGVLVALGILMMAGCGLFIGKVAHEADKTLNTEHTVVYQVTGDSQDVSVTYQTGGDNVDMSQDNNVKPGWSKEIKAKGIFGPHMSVTNGMDQNGKVGCKILVDGKVAAENESSGQLATATCSAALTKDSTK